MLHTGTSKTLAPAVARDERSLCRGGASRRRLAPCEGSAMSAPTLTYPLRAALDCAGHGFALVPLWWPRQGRCACAEGADCGSPGKHPLLEHGVHEASSDKDIVMQWFKRWPHANIGVATGALSGVVV